MRLSPGGARRANFVLRTTCTYYVLRTTHCVLWIDRSGGTTRCNHDFNNCSVSFRRFLRNVIDLVWLLFFSGPGAPKKQTTSKNKQTTSSHFLESRLPIRENTWLKSRLRRVVPPLRSIHATSFLADPGLGPVADGSSHLRGLSNPVPVY